MSRAGAAATIASVKNLQKCFCIRELLEQRGKTVQRLGFHADHHLHSHFITDLLGLNDLAEFIKLSGVTNPHLEPPCLAEGLGISTHERPQDAQVW